MLRLEDDWVWDSWIADDGALFHLFYLKAPRALADPRLRHDRAVVGHATSVDLRTWAVQPDALGPSESGWDDLAIWTGSVLLGPDGVWRMFYTALRADGHGLRDQRIGLATSVDLTTWNRSGTGPVVESDGRWYQTLEEDPGASETWRDPFVLPEPGGDGWLMLITARAAGAPRFEDGVVGAAHSRDLQHWQVVAPLSNTAGFGQIEVPQVRRIDGRWVLVFTCHPDEQSPAHRARHGEHSTWSLVGESPRGPWDLSRAAPFTADPTLFAAPLVQQRDGTWVLLGFRNRESEGIHSFEIVDPIEVHLDGDRLVGGASGHGASGDGASGDGGGGASGGGSAP